MANIANKNAERTLTKKNDSKCKLPKCSKSPRCTTAFSCACRANALRRAMTLSNALHRANPRAHALALSRSVRMPISCKKN